MPASFLVFFTFGSFAWIPAWMDIWWNARRFERDCVWRELKLL